MGSDPEARAVEGLHRDLEAVSFIAETVVDGDANIVELEFGCRRAADPELVLEPGGGEARRVGLHDEGGHPLATTCIRISQGEDGEHVGDRPVGDEALRAVEHVGVAVASGAHSVGGDVAAGRRLGEPEGDQPLPAGEPREVTRLLLVGAGQGDGQRAELLHDWDQAGGGVDPRDLLRQDDLRDLVERGAAVLLLEACAQQVLSSQQLLEVPREFGAVVDLRCAGRDPLLRELAHHGAQLVVLLGRQIGHAGSSCGARAGP